MGSDWWCEQALWRGVNTFGVMDPAAAFTGVVMILMPLVPNTDSKTPTLLIVLKACIVVLGAGTIVFHTIDLDTNDAHINVILIDWYPIVLVCVMLLVIYLKETVKKLSSVTSMALCIFFVSWTTFLIFSMETVTYRYMDQTIGGDKGWRTIAYVALLVPVIGTLAFYTYSPLGWSNSQRLWITLITSLVMWVINVYACKYAAILALLHSLYHLIITYSLIYAGCLGMTISGEWRIGSDFWPTIYSSRSKVIELKL
jgi:hypothetical protein